MKSKTFELKNTLKSLKLQNEAAEATHVHEKCVTYVREGLKTSSCHWNSLEHGSRTQKQVNVRKWYLPYVRKYFTYVKHEEQLINVREIKTNVHELENFSGNVREIGVTYVRMEQTATESIKYTPTVILPTPTIILIQMTINTSREDQKRVGQLQNSLSQTSYQFLPRKTSIQARDQSSTIKLIHSTLA